jgi:PEP-CTERM motif
MKVRFAAFAMLALAVALASPAFASTIQLGLNGDAQVGSNYIDFGQYPNGAPYTPAPGSGTFEVSLVNAGVFASAGVTTGEFGTIQSLNEPPGAVTLPSAFMTFDTGGSNLQLWATNIPPGDVGPFVFIDTADGAVVSFDVDGYVWDTNTSTKVDTFTGTFSATFDGETVADLFTELPIDTPFSGTFTATIIPTGNMPEPSTVLLLTVGLVGLGWVSRNRLAPQE